MRHTRFFELCETGFDFRDFVRVCLRASRERFEDAQGLPIMGARLVDPALKLIYPPKVAQRHGKVRQIDGGVIFSQSPLDA